MTGQDRHVGGRTLVIAAVLAGLAGLTLIALGWWLRDWTYQESWQRLREGNWWGGVITSTLGYLAFGKVGFKLALAVVVGAVAGSTWLRARGRPADPPPDEPVSD